MFIKNKDQNWIINVGLDSSGKVARRQRLYDAFNAQLCNKGLVVELKQSGFMGIDYNDALVEISSPDGEYVYYGLSTPDQVERIINGHLVGGKPIAELVIPTDQLDGLLVNSKRTAHKNDGPVGNNTRHDLTALNLMGIGWFIVVSILAGVLGGLWLDNRLNTEPLLMLVGLILGVMIAFLNIYRMLLPLVKNAGAKKTIDKPSGWGMINKNHPRDKGVNEQMGYNKRQPMRIEHGMVKCNRQARKQIQKAINHAKQKEEEGRQRTQKETKGELEAIITRMRSEIGQEKDNAVDSIRREFADLAVMTNKRVLGHSLDTRTLKQTENTNRHSHVKRGMA
jgi:F0F1-type ATP synthase assembly protein I/(2Fe-2S) ferredoxin/vacuolar-type H+-ATPase subunit H